MKKLLFVLLTGHCGISWSLAASLAGTELNEKYAPRPDEIRLTPELEHPQTSLSSTTSSTDDANLPQLHVPDAQTLLAQPELLERIMNAAVATQNINGIRTLLPVYQQYPQRNALTEELAQAILARAEAKPDQLAVHLRNILQRRPDAQAVRFQLATALHADQQYLEADQQLSQLQQQTLPEPILEEVKVYRSAIAQQNQWRWYGGIHFINEKNINNAPRQRRVGITVYNPQTHTYDFQGFNFEAPVRGRGIGYQLGGGRRLWWPAGFFATLDMDAQGRHIFQQTKYNDLQIRLASAIGHANWRNEWQIGPFVERRWFGNHAYARNMGISAKWRRSWGPRIQSFFTAEYGRQTHDKRTFLNNQNTQLSAAVLYQPTAAQYWLLGADYSRERDTRDLDDRFRRRGIRLVWGQSWPAEINTQTSVMLGRSLYDGPSSLSAGQRRYDRERYLGLSIWKADWSWKGLTPRLTLSTQQVRSNDAFRETDKKKAMLEIKKDW